MIGYISNNLLIPILDFFYGLVPSYGLAIVALTIVIRLALFPLSAGSIRSARRMKIAQPVMQKRQAEIKSKFANNPQKQQEELIILLNDFKGSETVIFDGKWNQNLKYIVLPSNIPSGLYTLEARSIYGRSTEVLVVQ